MQIIKMDVAKILTSLYSSFEFMCVDIMSYLSRKKHPFIFKVHTKL